MTRKYRFRVNKEPHDQVIDLTDIGGNNRTTVVRSKIDSSPSANTNDSPIEFVMEDKGFIKQSPIPEDPDSGFEEKLEAEGAFIVNSTTYFPASKQTVVKKSYTPKEIAEDRGYHDFPEV